MPRKNWVYRRITNRLGSHGVLLLIGSCFLFYAGLNAQVIQTRRILILNEENATYPGINIIDQGIQAGLKELPYQFQLYSEYMDTTLFPDPAVQQELRDAYIRKYQNRKLDLIITVGPSPLRFMEEVHRRAFPGVPIVFCLPAIGVPAAPLLDSDFAGVENDIAPAKTVEIALRLVPGTRNVVVVGGVAAIDRAVEANVKKELMPYEGRVEISYLTDLAMPDLLERLRRLPSNTIILLTSIGQDAAGTSFKASESGPLIIGAANVPVFSLFDVHMNHGEVGGDLSSLSEQGKAAGGIALKILRGGKAGEIPRIKDVNTYMFDWRALKRWGLKESTLPPGSTVINREPTVWESYKWYIIGGVVLMLTETLLIFGLLWQRRRRLALLHTLEQQTGLLQTREELLKIFVKNVPASVAMVDREMRYLQVSDRWCTDYLSSREQVVGRSHYELFPDMPERWKEVHRRALAGETLRAEEDHWVGQDGPHWARWEVRPWKTPEGTVGGILILAEDITQRKRAEEALRESEERFDLAAQAGKVYAYEYQLATQTVVRSSEYAKILGLTEPEPLTYQQFFDGIHADDRSAFLEAASALTPENPTSEVTYRFLRPIGGVVWLKSNGRGFFDSEQKLVRVVGMVTDVTVDKEAEKAMSNVSSMLIQAQERERTRIGRELHDDISQRLALLAAELGQFGDDPLTLRNRVQELQSEVVEISNDVQALSHELHSPKLEYLGAVAGMKSCCREFAERQKMEVDFSTDVAHPLPFEIGLCLFRVLQEALHNAVKHSGVKQVHVQLAESSNELLLTIRDSGVGFDLEEAKQGRGLGLTSMQERVRLVNGTIAIESTLGRGTTIHVHVPFISEEASRQAAS